MPKTDAERQAEYKRKWPEKVRLQHRIHGKNYRDRLKASMTDEERKIKRQRDAERQRQFRIRKKLNQSLSSQSITSSVNLKDFIDKCRCCFSVLSDEGGFFMIDTRVKSRFLELIRVELTTSDDLSNFICSDCNTKLNEFLIFQQMSIQNQKRLCQLKEESSSLKIKEEPMEDPPLNWSAGLHSIEEQEVTKYQNHVLKTARDVKEEPPEGWNVTSDPFEHLQGKFPNDPEPVVPEQAFVKVECEVEETCMVEQSWTLSTSCGNPLTDPADVSDCSQLSASYFECDLCGYQASTLAAIRSHMQHRDHNQEPCHRRIVQGVNFFQCPKCPKVYTLEPSLKYHLATHEKMPCEVCGKMCSPGIHYSNHLKAHEGKTFKCNVEGCGKQFGWFSGLHSHLNSIHNSNPVPCPICGVIFNHSHSLKKHIARTHSEKKFACKVEDCSYRTTRRDVLRIHYKSHKDSDAGLIADLVNDLRKFC